MVQACSTAAMLTPIYELSPYSVSIFRDFEERETRKTTNQDEWKEGESEDRSPPKQQPSLAAWDDGVAVGDGNERQLVFEEESEGGIIAVNLNA